MGLFEKLADKLGDIGRPKPGFDPAKLNDEVASKTSWRPLVPGGSRTTTHRLVAVYSWRIESKVSGMYLASRLVAILVVAGLAYIFLQYGFSRKVQIVIVVISGIVVLLGLITLIEKFVVHRVFDLRRGYYWKGGKNPTDEKIQKLKVHCKIEDIHAIQIIMERIQEQGTSASTSRNYNSFEINLVLKDASRLNVTDHGNFFTIRRDAELISGFLKVPVWDVTKYGQ